MKHLLPLLIPAFICLTAQNAFAQKQKKKIRTYEINDTSVVLGDTLKTNGKTFAFIESWGRHSTTFHEDFKVRSAAGSDILLLRYYSYANPNMRYSDGTCMPIGYYELFFYETGRKCELGTGGWWNKKDIALELLRNNLIVNDTTNTAAANQYVEINGMRYTEEQKQLYELQKLRLQQQKNTVIQKSYIDVN
ncbi:MAG: hypothetical protein WAQ28_07920 [Bacteroidia bacterium]